jgi:hypothetical protein
MNHEGQSVGTHWRRDPETALRGEVRRKLSQQASFQTMRAAEAEQKRTRTKRRAKMAVTG